MPRAEMLRSFVFGNNLQLTLDNVPQGTYAVYVWTVEDTHPIAATFTVEGSVVANYNSGSAGQWDRLGPFPVTVSDGNIQVGLQTTTDMGQICALEVWQVP